MALDDKAAFVVEVAQTTLAVEVFRAEACVHKANMVYVLGLMADTAAADWVTHVKGYHAVFVRDLGKPPAWCDVCGVGHTWCLKDAACAFVFADGLDDGNVFRVGQGCGRSFCWTCGLKYCRPHHDMWTGARLPGAKDSHDATCCTQEPGFKREEYCPGGHSGHCAKRW